MTDQVEAGAIAQEAAKAAPEFKTKAVPSAYTPEPAPEPAKEPDKPKAVAEAEPDDDAAEEDTEEAAASDGSDAPARPKNKGVGKRINELTREKHDALRELEYWKQQALKPAEPKPAAQAEPTPEATVSGEPKLEDFDFDMTAFNRAHYKWMRDEERKQEAIVKVQKTFVEKESAFEAEHPDYREVAYAPTLPMTQEMVRVILETDDPPAVAYYLGKNPGEAADIAQMQPLAAARAIGRIEAKLSAPASAPVREPPKKTTNAPPPPKTVSGAGKPEVSVDDPNISAAQRIALWKARRKT